MVSRFLNSDKLIMHAICMIPPIVLLYFPLRHLLTVLFVTLQPFHITLACTVLYAAGMKYVVIGGTYHLRLLT